MEQNNQTGTESTLGGIVIITGLILFLWSIFSIFYTFIANRTRRYVLRAIAWWIVLIFEIQALMLLYDRVLNPLPTGDYRWIELPTGISRIAIAYVILYIIAMWDTHRLNKREQLDI